MLKTMLRQRELRWPHVWGNRKAPRKMLEKTVQQGRRRVETRRRTFLGYVEDFGEPRTKLADFFSILVEEGS
jgi:hypothetical protein